MRSLLAGDHGVLVTGRSIIARSSYSRGLFALVGVFYDWSGPVVIGVCGWPSVASVVVARLPAGHSGGEVAEFSDCFRWFVRTHP